MTRGAWRERLKRAMSFGPVAVERLYERYKYVLFSPEDRMRVRLIGPDGWARTYRALRMEFYQREGKRLPDRNYHDGAILAARYLWLPRGCR